MEKDVGKINFGVKSRWQSTLNEFGDEVIASIEEQVETVKQNIANVGLQFLFEVYNEAVLNSEVIDELLKAIISVSNQKEAYLSSIEGTGVAEG